MTMFMSLHDSRMPPFRNAAPTGVKSFPVLNFDGFLLGSWSFLYEFSIHKQINTQTQQQFPEPSSDCQRKQRWKGRQEQSGILLASGRKLTDSDNADLLRKRRLRASQAAQRYLAEFIVLCIRLKAILKIPPEAATDVQRLLRLGHSLREEKCSWSEVFTFMYYDHLLRDPEVTSTILSMYQKLDVRKKKKSSWSCEEDSWCNSAGAPCRHGTVQFLLWTHVLWSQQTCCSCILALLEPQTCNFICCYGLCPDNDVHVIALCCFTLGSTILSSVATSMPSENYSGKEDYEATFYMCTAGARFNHSNQDRSSEPICWSTTRVRIALQ